MIRAAGAAAAALAVLAALAGCVGAKFPAMGARCVSYVVSVKIIGGKRSFGAGCGESAPEPGKARPGRYSS